MAKIGLIQGDNKIEYNIEKRQNMLIDLATACFEEGADLVFFPEAFQYDGNRDIMNDPQRLRDTADKWKARCAALAKKYRAYLVPWDYNAVDGRIYNSSYVLDREGNEVGRYCKCNLTSGEMKNGLSHGEGYPVFDLDIGKVGIMICFDNYFPESAASLANAGAELILYPLYGDTLKPQWELKLRTRAADHSLYVASCQLQSYFDRAFTGIADPEGNIIEKIDSVNSYKVVDIEMGRIVKSDTYANHPYGEDLRAYLHKCRNYKAYSSLVGEGTKPLEWDEIFFKE
jgi:predicted amidohydrolase